MTSRFLLGAVLALYWAIASANSTERRLQNGRRVIVGAPEEK